MTLSIRLQYILRRVVAIAILTAVLAGCGSTPTGPGELAALKQILKSCPPGKQVASKVSIDASGSARRKELGDRTAAVTSVVRRTAVCSGRLKVSLFSGTSAATVVLYDKAIVLPGATDNARLRRAGKAVDSVMRTIDEAYQPGLAKLSPQGSDIVSELTDAEAYGRQLGAGFRLELLILTDGYQQVPGGVNLGFTVLTAAQAQALATQLNVPRLPGASVTVAGIGRVSAAKPASSAVVEGTIRFWEAVCTRTQAERCLAVTDLSVGGQ